MDRLNNHILRVTHLSVKIQNQPILENVSFNVAKGTTLAILGPNGAGKTVLLRALLDLVPHAGKVEWEEKVRVGYVPQQINVSDIPISVKEFLSFKGPVNGEKQLALVRLDKSVLNKNLAALSGGMLRRVLIAWALVGDPNVLLFDEPTTGVDIGSEEPIFLMLANLKKEKEITMLLVSHDIHIVREYSDQLLALNKCVTFFGESKQINDPELQRVLFGEPVCIEA